jgi:hypothetical protein
MQLKQRAAWLSVGIITSLLPVTKALPLRAQTPTYTDIDGHWAEACIQNLSQQTIVSGYGDRTFRPDNIVTRAEYAAMLNQAFPNADLERSAINFVDVSDDFWGQDAIRRAYRQEFLSGYPDRTFRPNNIIERVEAFVALASGLEYGTPSSANQILQAAYADAGEIPDYAEGQIAAATQQGILISPPTAPPGRYMGPSDPATRAQVAAALCEIKFENSGVPADYVVNPVESPGEITLGQTCTNESIGFTVRYPSGWQTNSGGVINQCLAFDPTSVTLPERAESFDEAIRIRQSEISFNRATEIDDITERELSRRSTTVNGRSAIAVESETTGRGILPEGIRIYQYVINLDGGAVLASTYDIDTDQYERNKQILDQMMDSIEFD